MFLGRSSTQQKPMSAATVGSIDEEIRSIIDRNYQRADTILRENLQKLHLMADALMKRRRMRSPALNSPVQLSLGPWPFIK